MDKRAAAKLQRRLEKAIIEIILKLGLKNLPLLPAHHTVQEMAQAAVAVYSKAVDDSDQGTTGDEEPRGV